MPLALESTSTPWLFKRKGIFWGRLYDHQGFGGRLWSGRAAVMSIFVANCRQSRRANPALGLSQRDFSDEGTYGATKERLAVTPALTVNSFVWEKIRAACTRLSVPLELTPLRTKVDLKTAERGLRYFRRIPVIRDFLEELHQVIKARRFNKICVRP